MTATARAAASALFGGLIDDAAMFPPKEASLESALSDHLARRGAPQQRYIGSFLIPASRASDLCRVMEGLPRSALLPVGLVGWSQTEATFEGAKRLYRSGRVVMALLEVGLDPAAEVGEAVAQVEAIRHRAGRLGSPRVLCEVPSAWLDDDRLARVVALAAASGLSLKLRTGGTAPAAFPHLGAVAEFIAACVHHGVAFKCTAGLHRAVRRHHPSGGITRHGFANILLATHIALQGARGASLRTVLDERRPAVVAEGLGEVGLEEAAALRRTFLSYGSCDTSTPVRDIVHILLPSS